MYFGRPAGLGFSLNPIHAVKSAARAVGHGVKSGAKAVGHGAVASGKFVEHHAGTALLVAVPPLALAKYVAKPIMMAALKPVRNKVNQLKDRRAKKLAWDRRQSTTPTQAEKNEAKSWAKSSLRREKPPFGLMLSFLAGTPPPEPILFGRVEPISLGDLGDPTTAAIISSIPVLLEIMKSVLSHHDSAGDAPANAQGRGGAPGPAAAPGAPDANGGDAGGGDTGGDDGSGSGGAGGKHGKGGGGAMILGMPKKYVIIGGAVFGGIIVLSLLTSKKG